MGVSDADEILDHCLAAQEKIQAIAEKCRPLVSKLKISSILPLIYIPDDELTCEWIDRAKSLEFFKNSIHTDSIEQVDGLSLYICHLDSKYDDGFLELEQSTSVFCIIQQ